MMLGIIAGGAASATPVPPVGEVVYATWNPDDKRAGVVLSNGNLTAVIPDYTQSNVRATFGKSTGKWYWELNMVDVPSDSYLNAGVWLGPAYTGIAENIYLSPGVVRFTPGNHPTGTVLGFALDGDADTLSYYRDGVYGGQIALPNAGRKWYPVVGDDNNLSPLTVLANFGKTAFEYAPPAGFNVGVYQPVAALDLPNLVLWLDASDAATVLLSGGKVAQWNDKSGQENHAVQATDNNRYLVDPASVNGLDSLVQSTSVCAMLLSEQIVLPEGAHYAFIVVAQNGSPGTIFLSGSSGRYFFDIESFMGGGVYHNMADGSSEIAIGSAATNGSLHLHGFTAGSGGSLMHFDDAETATALKGGFTLTGITNYGSNYSLKGRICEIVVGTAELTSDQIAYARAYLKMKWGTP